MGTRMTRILANLYGFFLVLLVYRAKLKKIRANSPKSVSSVFP
jgi:uncharacterized membrane protein